MLKSLFNEVFNLQSSTSSLQACDTIKKRVQQWFHREYCEILRTPVSQSLSRRLLPKTACGKPIRPMKRAEVHPEFRQTS